MPRVPHQGSRLNRRISPVEWQAAIDRGKQLEKKLRTKRPFSVFRGVAQYFGPDCFVSIDNYGNTLVVPAIEGDVVLDFSSLAVEGKDRFFIMEKGWRLLHGETPAAHPLIPRNSVPPTKQAVFVFLILLTITFFIMKHAWSFRSPNAPDDTTKNFSPETGRYETLDAYTAAMRDYDKTLLEESATPLKP